MYSHTLSLESFFAHPIVLCSEDLIFVFDIHNKQVLGCNPACKNLTDCTESPFNLISPTQEEIVGKLKAESFEGNKCIRQEIVFSTSEGIKIPMIMRAMPFQSDSGSNSIWCFSLTNNQEKIGLEEMLKAHATNLEELAFLTSHEIRHEYVKLQAILKAFSEDSELPVNLKQLLSLGEQSIDKINRAIYKMNNRVTFSQQQLMKRPGKVASGNYQHLVLIDDDELTLLLNRRMLEEIGLSAEIHTFSVPDRAINWLKNQTNSEEILLFLDLNMPEKTGWEVLEHLEAERLSPDVVILTSSINKQDAHRATSHETVVSYVTKPLTIEAVQLVLASA